MDSMNEATRRERSPRLLPLLFGLGLGAFALGIALLVFFTKFPVEWHEAKQRFRLWKAGARPLVWEKHRGFHLDRCGGAAARDCPCVWLIHGLGDSVSTWRRFFVDSSAFDGTPVHLFAIDLPAHGGSLRRKNPEEYRVSAMAAEIDAEIAKTTACERNLLVGNSFGGWVASSLALASPR